MNSRTAARAIPAAELKDLAKRAFVRTGLSDDAAELIADSAVDSDLGGRTSHGVVRIPGYLAKARSGGIDPAPSPPVPPHNRVGLPIDARRGFGPPPARPPRATA